MKALNLKFFWVLLVVFWGFGMYAQEDYSPKKWSMLRFELSKFKDLEIEGIVDNKVNGDIVCKDEGRAKYLKELTYRKHREKDDGYDGELRYKVAVKTRMGETMLDMESDPYLYYIPKQYEIMLKEEISEFFEAIYEINMLILKRDIVEGQCKVIDFSSWEEK